MRDSLFCFPKGPGANGQKCKKRPFNYFFPLGRMVFSLDIALVLIVFALGRMVLYHFVRAPPMPSAGARMKSL